MQDLVTVADTRITCAEFGDYHYQEFLSWAFLDRQSKAALLRNMAIARTDSNQALIERKLSYYARLYKKTVEEIQQRILQADDEGLSVVELHRRLATEAGLSEKEMKRLHLPTGGDY
jgi:hypothetical protein